MLQELIDFIEFIIDNTKTGWINTAIIIICATLLAMVIWLSSKYKEIKENLSTLINDVKNSKRYRVVIGIVAVCICGGVFFAAYRLRTPESELESEPEPEPELYQEIAILNDENEIIYPIGVDILDKKVVDEFTFFTYKTSEKYEDDIISYPALYKWRKGALAERISERACPRFEIIKNSVVYVDSTLVDLSHGQLYVARPDGLNERILEEEIKKFWIDKEYVYFIYGFDTKGVGLDGHALHRMDLDGGNIVTVSYELSGPDLQGSHYDVQIEGEWAIYDNYKIKMGNPADGLEKVVLLEDTDADWIYYTSNRLIKAKPDGSKQVILDDIDDYWYQIDKIENGWIHYQKGDDTYKIDINGNNKTEINPQEEEDAQG